MSFEGLFDAQVSSGNLFRRAPYWDSEPRAIECRRGIGDSRNPQMILNRTHRFLFVHVPKTAGMAVSAELSQFTTSRDLHFCEPWDELNLQYKEAYGLSKHSTAAEIRSVIGQQEFNALFKFAFVRNPFFRAYSIFRFLKYNFREWENSEIMDTFGTFDDFIASDFFQGPGPDRIFEPQTFWMTDQKGELMVDWLGRMEELESELREIHATLGLGPLGKLRPENVSGPSGALSRLAAHLPGMARIRRFLAPPRIAPTELSEIYGSEETRRIVAARYSRDFEMFYYSPKIFSNAAERSAKHLEPSAGAMLQ